MLRRLPLMAVFLVCGSCSLSLGPQDNQLSLAASRCSSTQVEEILEDGYWSVTKSDEFGRYPLEYATHDGEGCLDVVRILLNAGADPNSRSGTSETPLSVAVLESSSPEMIRQLLESGGDLCLTVEVPSSSEIGEFKGTVAELAARAPSAEVRKLVEGTMATGEAGC